MRKILIIDDNKEFCELLSEYLKLKAGYDCDIALNKEEVAKCVESTRYDLITLDIELEEDNGIELIPMIKSHHLGPMILISCISDLNTKISGLRNGVDDYLVKPIAMEELLLRANNLVNRYSMTNYFYMDEYCIDEVNKIVYKNDSELKMNETTTMVLTLLLRNKGKALTREQIFEAVWGIDLLDSRAVDNAVAKIRKQTDDNRFRTVRGVGYQYGED